MRPALHVEDGSELGGLWLLRRQEFQSYEAAELDILSLVDDTHTTTAQLFNDAVMRDGLADHGIEPW